jgi:hypothetical protein
MARWTCQGDSGGWGRGPGTEFAVTDACGCQKVSRRLRAADSPKEVFTQMIGGWRYDWSI